MSEKVALAGRFLKRKMEEYEALKAEIESLKFEFEDRQGNAKGQSMIQATPIILSGNATQDDSGYGKQ